jgi:hypothetical protein
MTLQKRYFTSESTTRYDTFKRGDFDFSFASNPIPEEPLPIMGISLIDFDYSAPASSETMGGDVNCFVGVVFVCGSTSRTT